jgi:hypothetical protein
MGLCLPSIYAKFCITVELFVLKVKIIPHLDAHIQMHDDQDTILTSSIRHEGHIIPKHDVSLTGATLQPEWKHSWRGPGEYSCNLLRN